MWLCHGWGWQPPQTDSRIHIRHIQSVWVHWYAILRHMVAALHSYAHPTWVRFWGSGSLVESNWCDYVMVEADGQLKLLPTAILDICKVFEHIYAVHRHTVAALHSFSHSNRLIFWSFGSLVVVESKWCDYVMVEADSQLKLLPPSILDIGKVFEHIDMLSECAANGHSVAALNSYTYTPRRKHTS